MTADRARTILALLVAGAWLAAGAAAFAGYRPGGAADGLIGLAALPPLALALLTAVPPRRSPDAAAGAERSLRLLAAVGAIGALLLLVPLTAALAGPAGPAWPGAEAWPRVTVARLLPSPSLGWTCTLAAALTGLLALAALAGRAGVGEEALRARRGLALTTAAAIALFGVSVAVAAGILAAGNAGTVPAAATSPYGPAGPLDPPACDGPLAPAAGATVRASGSGDADGRALGSVTIDGERGPAGARWSATYATAWGSGTATEADAPGAPLLDDALVLRALSAAQRVGADDLGIDLVEGARARHCRIVTDGASALQAFLPLRWLTGGDAREAGAAGTLGPWRGFLDYWLFADGRVGLATVEFDGQPASDWPITGLQARLRATLSATNRVP